MTEPKLKVYCINFVFSFKSREEYNNKYVNVLASDGEAAVQIGKKYVNEKYAETWKETLEVTFNSVRIVTSVDAVQ